MSDLVGNPKDRFSQNEAHILIFKLVYSYAFVAIMQASFESQESTC